MKKKLIVLALVSALVAASAGCNGGNNTTTTTAPQETPAASTEATTEAAPANEVKVMSYEDFKAADVESPVTVETYVQAKQGWWEDNGVGKATFYTQNEEGAYFIYDMPCSQEDYDKLTAGTKIRVSGYKAEWSGEVEISDATFEIIDGNFIAAAEDVTDLLDKNEIIDQMNKFVSFKGMTVEPSTDKDGNTSAYLYNWDGSGSEGNDLYFNVSKNGKTYTFTVRAYLCGKDTEVYKAVKNLHVGDVVDMEGFLYWYNGVNPHITSVTVVKSAPDNSDAGKSDGVMSYADYVAADVDTPVVVETYIQAKQSWWEDNGVGQASFYTQDEDGGYFIYNMPCSFEEYNALVPGTKIKVSGYKSEWAGEVEITDAKFEVEEGTYIAEPVDVTGFMSEESKLSEYMNRYVVFKNVKIKPITDANDEEHGFLYSWDGSGDEGSDLYFKGVNNSYTLTFTVESYLCGPGTEVYEAVKALTPDQMVDLEGYLYWYNGANPHITSVKVIQ